MKHQFWQLVEKLDKSNAEKVAVVATSFAMCHQKYSHLTPEQTFEALLADWPLFAGEQK